MSEKNNNMQKTSDKSMDKFRIITEDPKLKKYLIETLRVEDLRNKRKQTKISNPEEREIKNNDDKKVYFLNNYIFGSMANLIYFFRFMLTYPELIDRFGEDIEELLGLKEEKPKEEETSKEAKSQYLGFYTLINLILNYPSHFPSDHEFSFDQTVNDARFNFKRHLLPILQSIIYHKTNTIMKGRKEDMLLNVMVADDFQRVETWTKLVDKEPKHTNKPIRRKIIISPKPKDKVANRFLT